MRLLHYYQSRPPLVKTLIDFVWLFFLVELPILVLAVAFSLDFLGPREDYEPQFSIEGLDPTDLLRIVLITPFIEELVFRGLPLVIYSSLKSHFSYWLLGLSSAVLFAMLHGGSAQNFPLNHFVAGLVYWKIAVERGLSHAVLLHALNNLTVGLIVLGATALGGEEA